MHKVYEDDNDEPRVVQGHEQLSSFSQRSATLPPCTSCAPVKNALTTNDMKKAIQPIKGLTDIGPYHTSNKNVLGLMKTPT